MLLSTLFSKLNKLIIKISHYIYPYLLILHFIWLFWWGFFLISNLDKVYILEIKPLNVEIFDVIFHQNKTFYDIFIVLSAIFFLVMLLLSQANLLNKSLYPNSKFDSEKYSPYECGFAPFKTERSQFDIKFYLIALLFLVFDVELMFFLPYCLSYFYLGLKGYLIFFFFFIILLLGFLVEWSAGMLVWKSDTLNQNYENKTFNLSNKYANRDGLSLSVEILDLILEADDVRYSYARRVFIWHAYVLHISKYFARVRKKLKYKPKHNFNWKAPSKYHKDSEISHTIVSQNRDNLGKIAPDVSPDTSLFVWFNNNLQKYGMATNRWIMKFFKWYWPNKLATRKPFKRQKKSNLRRFGPRPYADTKSLGNEFF